LALCNARQVADIQIPTEVSLIRESKKCGEVTEILLNVGKRLHCLLTCTGGSDGNQFDVTANKLFCSGTAPEMKQLQACNSNESLKQKL
jgi:hypothetical protein